MTYHPFFCGCGKEVPTPESCVMCLARPQGNCGPCDFGVLGICSCADYNADYDDRYARNLSRRLTVWEWWKYLADNPDTPLAAAMRRWEENPS